MRNLAKTCAIVAICLGATGGVSARSRPTVDPSKLDLSKPIVLLSAPPTPMYLGTVPGPGPRHLKTKMTVRVLANCPFHVTASFRGLNYGAGKVAIPARDMEAAVNGQQAPVGTNKMVWIASGGPTPMGGVDIPIELDVIVKGSSIYPAGRYNGDLVVTVVAGS